MTAYDVKIESTTEDEIVFNADTAKEGEAIKKVIFKMNTLEDAVLNRSSAVRCELMIEGLINKLTKEMTMKLAKWSMTGSGESLLYRKVTVIVYTDNDREEVLRQYTIDKMFCVDYDEIFGDKEMDTQNEAGSFILRLAQREGAHSKDIYAK